MLNRWTTIGGLLLLVGVTSQWLIYLEQEPGIIKSEVSHLPDSYMEDFTRTDMDENGLIKRRLRGESMKHFADDDSSELLRLQLEIYRDGLNPWYVIAERAWVSGDSQLIQLFGEVHIWNNDAKGERAVEVITRDVRALPETEYAETDQAATIITPSSITHGVGLRAYLGSERLELLDEVKTHYEVKAAHQ